MLSRVFETMTNQQTKILKLIRRGPTNGRAIATALGHGLVACIARDLDVLEEKNLISCAMNVSGNHVRATIEQRNVTKIQYMKRKE